MIQQLNRRPLAFVAPDGFVIPCPKFQPNTIKYFTGRFLYTTAELSAAIAEQERLTQERRVLADMYVGEDAQRFGMYEGDTAEDVIDRNTIQTETVPSFAAVPTRPRKPRRRVPGGAIPSIADTPATLHEGPRGMNMTQEQLDESQGIDANAAVAAMFGKPGA